MFHAYDILSVFDKGVLESSAGSEKWYLALTRESNRVQSALHVFVRTSWNAPDALIRRELYFRMQDLRCGDPDGIDPHPVMG
jgi:hypothetical protein